MIFASVIDCTGHGVPGALMSIIANAVLNDIVETNGIYDPAAILSELSFRIATMLAQDSSDNKDGMDMALCRFITDNDGNFLSLTFSGAKNPLYIWHQGDTEYQIVKADRKSVAGGVRNQGSIQREVFQESELPISKGDTLYMSSDGILDMCDSHRKRYTRTRFVQLINRIHPLKMESQATEIEKVVERYLQETEQRDDISVLGLRIL
jgi:serine phosphatase RsbU (regulator of sigma subunit)